MKREIDFDTKGPLFDEEADAESIPITLNDSFRSDLLAEPVPPLWQAQAMTATRSAVAVRDNKDFARPFS